ncbi:MAG TPA: hypothetical protein DSN98_09180 [Thermoplasmata archaeon]|jgi:hypothetical protein|nr:MAG TPA: hypothetical protein DSN98_09180 [Thermoplasmata archaeon]
MYRDDTIERVVFLSNPPKDVALVQFMVTLEIDAIPNGTGEEYALKVIKELQERSLDELDYGMRIY